MRFKGQLFVPSERGPGLPVDLEVAEHHLALVSGREELGAWPLGAITARRVRGDTFAITLAGEDLHFVAEDTISFAYSGMPAIEQYAGSSRTRSPLRTLLDIFWHDSSEPDHAPEETLPLPPSAIDEFPPFPEDDSLPPEEIPHEAEPPRHAVETEPQVSGPRPELHPPSSAGTGSSGPRISAEEELRGRSEPERPTRHPSNKTKDPDEVIEWSQTVPPSQRHDTSSDAKTIESVDQNEPREHEPTATPRETILCRAVRSDGLPCRSPVAGPSGYCHAHDPESAFGQGFRKAQEARESLKRKEIARLTSVYARLDKAFRQVERGDLDPDKAMAIAQLARAMCAILELTEESPVNTDEDSPPLSPNRSAVSGDKDTHSRPRPSSHDRPTDDLSGPEGYS